VKNLSASQQANSITVQWIDSTDSSPSFTDQHEINAGSGYAATQNIGNLASGAISSVLTARFTASTTQPLSLWATILEAEAGSWT
jgi:putative salt-induced outer membrane protein YdiY